MRLAIEVSDSSLQSDSCEKVKLYAEAGIVEHWIVDADASCIHVYRDPQGDQFTDRGIANLGDKIAPMAAPDAALDLNDLFAAE